MRRPVVAAIVATSIAAIVAGGANAGGLTTVQHLSSGPYPDNVCGFAGTTTIHQTFVIRRTSTGTFFDEDTFFRVFTTASGKSATIFAAGAGFRSTPPVIDARAGTVTLVTTQIGLPEKLSITNGPTLSRDAGTVTLTDVFQYSGDPAHPAGDFVSESVSFLNGPHPELDGGFSLFCDVLTPYFGGA